MGLFNFKKKNENALSAYQNTKMADLTAVLDKDELDLLATDLWSYGKMRPDIKELANDLKTIVKKTGSVPEDKLPVCIEAVETALRTFGAVGMSAGAHTHMLEKLKKMIG